MNFFFSVSISIILIAAVPASAIAQKSFNFQDNIDLDFEAHLAAQATFAPIQPVAELLSASTGAFSILRIKYAALLNKDVAYLNNISLFKSIEEWYGTRYRFGGTTKKGIDCSSFTAQLMRSVYARELPRTARAQYVACTKIEKHDLTEGDLVFFNTRGGVSHVGFYLDNGYFVHASSSQGVTISNLDDIYYHSRYIGGGRYALPLIDFSRVIL